MKQCKLCATDIPDNARKCTICGEFQSLPSRVFARIDLKGLLALLPLLTLIYAFLAERFDFPYSELRITPVDCAESTVTIFASNNGNRMSLLESAQFAAESDATSTFILPDDLSTRIFDAGESRLVALSVDPIQSPGGLVSFESAEADSCIVNLTFSVVQYDHSKTRKTASCACPSS